MLSSIQDVRALLRSLHAGLDVALWAEVEPAYRSGVDAHGFIPELDESWHPVRETPRRLVQTARMTWAAAELARRCGDQGAPYAAHARHGARALLKRFADPEHGGMFWEIEKEGAPSVPSRSRKHAYGSVFGIYALANAGAALAEDALIDAAFEQFLWLDTHGHDERHGGYLENFERDGTPITDGSEPGDQIARPAGYKSMNAHLHIMEACTRLAEVRPEPLLIGRLRELIGLFTDRMIVEPGCTHQYCTPDWRGIPGRTSYGHDVELGFLLIEAVRVACPQCEAKAWELAAMLIDHAIAFGYDRASGGFSDEGDGLAKASDQHRTWWVQAEAINACSLMYERYPDRADQYLEPMLRTWSFVQEHLLDTERGGWRPAPDTQGPSVGGSFLKIGPWKTVYHTARAMIETRERLGRMLAC